MNFISKHRFTLAMVIFIAFGLSAIWDVTNFRTDFCGWGLIYFGFMGYFMGAMPFGLLITGLMGLGDVRQIGSGNIGATNVLRTGNKSAAALTLIFDALKGFLPVFFAMMANPEYGGIALLGSLIGHCFSIWLGFAGGKGVATYIGAVFGLAWPLGVLACAIWAGVAVVGRMSSLASLSMVALIPVFSWLLGWGEFTIWLMLAMFLIFWKHKANIQRLVQGSEPRIGSKS